MDCWLCSTSHHQGLQEACQRRTQCTAPSDPCSCQSEQQAEPRKQTPAQWQLPLPQSGSAFLDSTCCSDAYTIAFVIKLFFQPRRLWLIGVIAMEMLRLNFVKHEILKTALANMQPDSRYTRPVPANEGGRLKAHGTECLEIVARQAYQRLQSTFDNVTLIQSDKHISQGYQRYCHAS